MRDLLVFGIVLMLLPVSFRRPFIGLLLFSWLAYMRPQDLCWSFARGMRFSFYVGLTMVVGWWVNESHKRRFFKPETRSYLLIALGVLISISLLFASHWSYWTAGYYIEFVKIIVIALFTMSQVDSKSRLRAMLWVICISLAFYSVKNGLIGIVRGGSIILRGPGGMLEDNNDFALALVMNIPLLYYLSRLEKHRLLRLVCNVAILLTAVTVLLTHSRGGFLAMSCTMAWMAFRSGHLVQAGLVICVLILGFFTFAPEHVIDRILSIGQGTTDSSVASRMQSWSVAVQMVVDYPVWGVGLRNFIDFSHYYAVGGLRHVAHNSYLQIAAEGGVIAFTVYITLLMSVFWSCMWLRRVAKARPELRWVGSYASMFEAINVGFMVGGTFLNRGHFDLIYHFVSLVGCTMLITKARLLRAPAAVPLSAEAVAGEGATEVSVDAGDSGSGAGRGGVVSVRWRTPVGVPMPRWERST